MERGFDVQRTTYDTCRATYSASLVQRSIFAVPSSETSGPRTSYLAHRTPPIAPFLFACLTLCCLGDVSTATAFDLPLTVEDNSRYTLILGSRAWISQGRSAHNIAGLNGQPNVVSELTYSGVNSRIAQGFTDLVLRQIPYVTRLVISVNGGYGPLGSGTLRDQDWLGNNRTVPLSDTTSAVTGGHVAHASLDVGWRPLEWRWMNNPLPGGLDLLVGYQFWQEEYSATGVIVNGVQINNLPAITQTNTWNSLRVGSRAFIPVHSYVSLRGSAFLIPWTHYQSDDVHHQRASLAQDPSFRTIATGGLGVQLEGALLLRLWRGLSAEAGYAYWDIKSGSGTTDAFFSNGTGASVPFNQENTRRQGVFFGLNYVF